MKADNVKIGGVYLTKIAGSWDRVVVVQRREAIPSYTTPSGYRHKAERVSFDVRRENEDRVLPKPRNAAHLQEV
jgi:hypothetical protein